MSNIKENKMTKEHTTELSKGEASMRCSLNHTWGKIIEILSMYVKDYEELGIEKYKDVLSEDIQEKYSNPKNHILNEDKHKDPIGYSSRNPDKSVFEDCIAFIEVLTKNYGNKLKCNKQGHSWGRGYLSLSFHAFRNFSSENNMYLKFIGGGIIKFSHYKEKELVQEGETTIEHLLKSPLENPLNKLIQVFVPLLKESEERSKEVHDRIYGENNNG